MKSRLANTPEDYKKIGIKEGTVEVWEDGRRNDSRSSAFEWWYLDVVLEDGTKAAFTYEHEGKKVVYTIEETERLEIRDEYAPLPEPMKAMLDKMLLQPSYSRLFGKAELTIIDGGNTETVSGDLIYELAYLGKNWLND